MQQTALDRWLKETFVYETHVFTLSAPPWVPKGVKLRPLETTIKNRYRYSMVIRGRRNLEKALQALTDASQTYSTKVEPRKSLARVWFDASDGGSFTWRVIGLALGLASFVGLVYIMPWDKVHRIGEAFEFLGQYID